MYDPVAIETLHAHHGCVLDNCFKPRSVRMSSPMARRTARILPGHLQTVDLFSQPIDLFDELFPGFSIVLVLQSVR